MAKTIARLTNSNLVKGESGFYGGGEVWLPKGFEHLEGMNEAQLTQEMIKLADTTTTTITEDIPVIVSPMVIETLVSKRVVRKIVPTDSTLVNAPGSSIRYPEENVITFAQGSEGSITLGETAIDTGDGITATPGAPYMGGFKITYQSIEDGLHDWVKRGAKMCGRDAAVAEDKLALGTFYNGAAATEDKTDTGWDATSGWASNIKDDLLSDVEAIEVEKGNCDYGIFNTVLSKYLRIHPDFYDYAVYGGAMHDKPKTDMREAGIQGNIYGFEVVTTPNQYESTSYANTDTYLLMDSEFAANMVDKRPFQLKQHDYPENDELWVIATYRVAPTVLKTEVLAGKTDVLSPS